MTAWEECEKKTQQSKIVTDRQHTPTCQWCGTDTSHNWKYVIGTGKSYCSDNCCDAAYYRFYVLMLIVSVIGFPTSIIAYFTLNLEEYRQFAEFLFYAFAIGLVAGICYTYESRKVRSQVSKNSRSTQGLKKE
ncbi:MAG: hypothetical protein JW779_06625 [Candidatus Thorarchaeota archaeon]|nr:hypothetical protein [Candidatus Thorarchaeota archaeon]